MRYLDHQEQAKRATGSLIFYFTLGFLAVILSVTLATLLLLSPFQGFYPPPEGKWAYYEFRWILLGVTLATAAGMLLASWWKMSLLRTSGGEGLARSLGGRMLRPDTTNPLERRLMNVVEEMAIASQTPRPLIYVLGREQGVNAFVAGYTPHQAVLAVTRGALELLRRDELQALVAHEFSHIKSGDMRLNLRLMGLIHGILFLAYTGHFLLRHSARSTGGDGDGVFLPGILAGGILAAVGSAGGLCGALLKAGISRQREFLADASAVQFTRNPQALLDLLLLIGGCSRGSALDTPKAPEASHMFFADGLNTWLSRRLATHPTLAQRITRIAPMYAGPLPGEERVDEEALKNAARQQAQAEMVGFARFFPTAAAPMPDSLDTPPVESDQQREYARHAKRLLGRLPLELTQAARSSKHAPAVLCAMLLSQEEGAARRAMDDVLLQHADVDFYDQAQELSAQLSQAPAAALLPLLDVLLPALLVLEANERQELRKRVQALITADKKIRLFQWMLGNVLERHRPLESEAEQSAPQELEHGSRLAELAQECRLLLSAMAHWGARKGRASAKDISRAYAAGAACLQEAIPGFPDTPLEERPGLREVDAALQLLAGLTPPARQKLLEACSACAHSDCGVTQAQGELLRGAAALLRCPMPALLPGMVTQGA